MSEAMTTLVLLNAVCKVHRIIQGALPSDSAHAVELERLLVLSETIVSSMVDEEQRGQLERLVSGETKCLPPH